MRKRLLAAGLILTVGAGFGALVGCEQIAVTALNQIHTTEFTVSEELLFMSGEINSRTRAQFEQVIADHPEITTLVLCNVPGSLDDDTMIPLTYRVRALGLATLLTPSSEVASGGTDLFLGGSKRQIMPGARLGVHSWSDGVRQASDYPADAPEHRANAQLIDDMLGDDAFYWYTIAAAPADDIHWMTAAEIETYGLATTPHPDAGPTCP